MDRNIRGEMLEERRFEHGSEYLWKDRCAKTLNILKGGLKLEGLGSLEEEKRWMQSRPTMREIQDLLEKTPREDTLSSEERSSAKHLREIKLRASELAAQIAEVQDCQNLRKLRSLWAKGLDLGVRIVSFFREASESAVHPSSLKRFLLFLQWLMTG